MGKNCFIDTESHETEIWKDVGGSKQTKGFKLKYKDDYEKVL